MFKIVTSSWTDLVSMCATSKKSRRQVLGSLPNESLTPRAEVCSTSRTPRLPQIPVQPESRASFARTEDDSEEGWRIHLKPSQVHRMLTATGASVSTVDFRRKKTDVRRTLSTGSLVRHIVARAMLADIELRSGACTHIRCRRRLESNKIARVRV
jgi:hypothetical protein